jgi:hypothetical protein
MAKKLEINFFGCKKELKIEIDKKHLKVMIQEVMTEERYPNLLEITGFDFMHQGWNYRMLKSGAIKNGAPVYILKPYDLYFFIRIRPLRLQRNAHKQWILSIDDCYGADIASKLRDHECPLTFIDGSHPCGEYSGPLGDITICARNHRWF